MSLYFGVLLSLISGKPSYECALRFLFFIIYAPIGLKTILDIAAVIEHFAVKSGICGDKNLFALKQVYHFWGFSMVKIHFFQKVLKNGLVSEKNYIIFYHF